MKVVASKFPFAKVGTQYKAENPHPGKVTGTAMGGILGLSPWDTPFSVACRLLRIFREDIDDKPAVKAGKALEGPIIEHMNARGYKVIPAEDIFDKREGAHDEWGHDFDDPIFGGHVDGITEDGDIVEVKTTSNPEPWLNGIPEHYWLQASLYAKFMGASKVIFAVGVLGKDDTSNPYAWVPSEDTCFIFETGLHPDIDRHVDYIRGWYADYIAEGITPEPDLGNEIDCAIIKALDAQLGDPSALLDELETIEARLKEFKALKDRADEIKEQVLLHMDYRGLSVVEGASKDYTLTETTRTAVDTDRLKADGLYETYSKTTKSKSLKAKKRK